MSHGRFADQTVSVEFVGYTFTGGERPSLADVSLTFEPRSLVVLAGQTGSGKSTLLRMLAGLIPNSAAGRMEGRVRLFDLDTAGASSLDLATRAGLALQSPDDQICTTHVESEVAFGLENLCLSTAEIERRLEAWLDRFGLSAQRAQSTGTLSGGQKQRLTLASILAMGPRLLLLDEPLAQLDALGAAELLDELDRLRAAGWIVVVAEHRLDELLGRADRLLILADGRLVADCPAAGERAIAALTHAELLTPPAPPIDPRGESDPRATPVARVRELSLRWPRVAQPLWSDVGFDIRPGERVALVGPNGSGKTTLLSALAGQLAPETGRVELAIAPPGTMPIGLTPQNPDLTLFCSTVREELAFGPRQLGLSEDEVARRVSGASQALAIEDLLDTPPLALSQGQRLRVAVAAAITLHPRLLLLDEPTTGQDPRQVDRLLTAVSGLVARGDVGAVLFSTHDSRLIERFATRVLAVGERKLLADCPPAAILADDALLARTGLRATPRGRPTPKDDWSLARPTS